MKTVLVVSKYFHPHESGSEKTTRYIIDYLSEKEFKVILFCAKGSKDRLNKKAKFYSMDRDKLYNFMSKKKNLKELSDIFIGGLYLLKIFFLEKIDIVNIHYSESIGLPAVIFSKMLGRKSVVLWPTSSLMHSKMTDTKLSFISSKIYSYLSDAFLAKGMPSLQMRKYFRIRKEKLFETVNPVEQKDYDPGECNYREEKLGIYYLGKYNNFKRPDILVKAAAILKDEDKKKVRVFLYGNGPYEAMIKNLVREKNLESIVFINSPTNNVKEVIKSNHIFVYPSLYEPAFSQSILESLGSGRIVICRKTAGVAKYFDDESILGILPMNEIKLADAISWIINHRDEAGRVASNAKKIILEKFTFDNFMKQYLVHL